MQRPALIFENSPFFIIICLLLGLAYAFLLYKKTGPWGILWNKVLFVLRTLLVALLATLLVSPILKQIQNNIEAPTFVIALDNSTSISEVMDSVSINQLKTNLTNLSNRLTDNGYEVVLKTFDQGDYQDLQEVQFESAATDIDMVLRNIDADYEGRNLSSVLLVSDGIYNQGISPGYRDYRHTIYTIGVGDTIPKSDLSINSLQYNKISYQGNKFPLVVQLTHQGYSNQSVIVSVNHKGNMVGTQRIVLSSDNQIDEVTFLIDADTKGFQRYTVAVERQDNEFTYVNNVQQAYVEVIEGKEKIGIIASAPHPDIKAIRSAIESNANYELDQYILSIPENVNRLRATKEKYDLIIFHQIPDKRGVGNAYIGKFKEEGTASLMIYGPQMDLRRFKSDFSVVDMTAVPNEYDNITAVFNQSFSNFKLSENLVEAFDNFPPITVPYGKTSINQGAEVMLYQRVGSIATNKPLIVVNSEETPKQGLILGSGLWQWKLTDFAENDDNKAFNELITKLVQFLSSKEDKRKFKAYPIKNEFLNSESVIFDAEVYNDLYERIYENKIDITITDGEGKAYDYTYVTNRNNTRYTINDLPDGVYQYAVSTYLGKDKETLNGEFLVKSLNI
ncbi:MAG: VWA domain-containing protein, partial [Bacteroidota bacterium]